MVLLAIIMEYTRSPVSVGKVNISFRNKYRFGMSIGPHSYSELVPVLRKLHILPECMLDGFYVINVRANELACVFDEKNCFDYM